MTKKEEKKLPILTEANPNKITIGDLIIDHDAGTLIVVDIKKSEDDKMGTYDYEVYWTRNNNKSWISEIMLIGIKSTGVKNFFKLLLEALSEKPEEEKLVDRVMKKNEDIEEV